MLYAMLKKIKVAPVYEIVKHWLHSFKTATPILCTSLITRLAASVNPQAANSIVYLTSPRIMINERYLAQAHVIKRNASGNGFVFYFPGYINEIPLPNPDLALYTCPSLTFELVEKEEARRSSASRRESRRMRQEEAAQQAQPTQPTPAPAAPERGWSPTMTTPGFTPGYGYGMGYVPSPYEAGGSGWQEMYRAGGSRGQHSHEAGGSGQPHQEHTLDEEDMPPPIRPQVTLDSLNTRMGGLELQQRQIQGTLNAHIQTSTQWHQQTQQSFVDLEDANRRRHEEQLALLRSIGFFQGPQQ
jgi:hypothetical protein